MQQQKWTTVFLVSVSVTLLLIIWGVVNPDSLNSVTSDVQGFLQVKFGWFYLLSVTSFLVFVIILIFTRAGNIRLGKDDEEPEYSYLSWFAMLFSAGMGIGLVFWGVAEPMYHFISPPVGEGGTTEAARVAMKYSFFHWGLHPWGIYTLTALALAYFKFRKGAPGLISATFTPLLGDRVNGPIGKTIDVLAVYATVIGVATSLGLGAMQISSGLNFLTGIPNDRMTQLMIIAVVTVLFMISAGTGLNKGIKYLSNTNMVLALALMVFILFVGPTNFIINFFTTTIGTYIQELPTMSLRVTPFTESDLAGWIQDWTIFYWAWWISWAPFVGMFIARVSRGRTVREFVIGVLAVPTLLSGIWFATLGGAGIYSELFGKGGINNAMTDSGTEVALFTLLSQLPLSGITSTLAVLLITTFFITSADSATFVLGMQTTNGQLNPPNRIKFTWGIIQAASAAVLLYAGGLTALQMAAIIAAFPFAFILIGMCISLAKSFKADIAAEKKKK
ncbi:BCCT family transporter [Mechercharimyces sp. CAU 1602]|uniref:glycine betaine uptake BCCT transporter n=1 Tax=Mechercharimyces sp. CAU 1602 TaxID=2973933 RepID=UPI002163DB50|nr:BCCT family transporter [Mechercharimyces sp. CAU 1602]MCS1351898.1 BCCT family transporter [Mechercharimyces sp. CAU 1602]